MSRDRGRDGQATAPLEALRRLREELDASMTSPEALARWALRYGHGLLDLSRVVLEADAQVDPSVVRRRSYDAPLQAAIASLVALVSGCGAIVGGIFLMLRLHGLGFLFC